MGVLLIGVAMAKGRACATWRGALERGLAKEGCAERVKPL